MIFNPFMGELAVISAPMGAAPLTIDGVKFSVEVTLLEIKKKQS